MGEKAIKTRYGDKELKEFEQIIDKKLEKSKSHPIVFNKM